MKRLLLMMCLGVVAMSASAQKQRYSSNHNADPLDYPVTVRVSHARLVRPFAAAGVDQSSGTYLHLDALIDNKHVELEANAAALLHVGDYSAREVTNTETKSGFFSRSYELLFRDGTKVIFLEVAESE